MIAVGTDAVTRIGPLLLPRALTSQVPIHNSCQYLSKETVDTEPLTQTLQAYVPDFLRAFQRGAFASSPLSVVMGWTRPRS